MEGFYAFAPRCTQIILICDVAFITDAGGGFSKQHGVAGANRPVICLLITSLLRKLHSSHTADSILFNLFTLLPILHVAMSTFPTLFKAWDFSLHILPYTIGPTKYDGYDAAPLRILEYPNIFSHWRTLSTTSEVSRFKIVLYAVHRRVVGEGYRAAIDGPMLYDPMTLEQATAAVKSLATGNKGISWLGNNYGVPKLKEATPAQYEKRASALGLTDILFLTTSSEWEASRPAWEEARAAAAHAQAAGAVA